MEDGRKAVPVEHPVPKPSVDTLDAPVLSWLGGWTKRRSAFACSLCTARGIAREIRAVVELEPPAAGLLMAARIHDQSSQVGVVPNPTSGHYAPRSANPSWCAKYTITKCPAATLRSSTRTLGYGCNMVNDDSACSALFQARESSGAVKSTINRWFGVMIVRARCFCPPGDTTVNSTPSYRPFSEMGT